MPIAAAMAAAGQSPALLRVAWVSPERAGSTSPNLTAFRTGLRELGYMEGKNLVIDTWWGEGFSERLEQMAGDIVRARPDVIVTGSGVAVYVIPTDEELMIARHTLSVLTAMREPAKAKIA